MSDCVWLSDRMPVVALGRAAWSSDESRHLWECRSCQAEWELVQMTSRLGEAVVFSPHPERTAQSVLQRVKREEVRIRPRLLTLVGLGTAAAIVAGVWIGGRDAAPVRETAPAVARLQIPLPELEGLQPTELDSVLETMDEAGAGDSTMEDPGLGDLDNDELQRVLDSWEG
jgi:hypothetical protein